MGNGCKTERRCGVVVERGDVLKEVVRTEGGRVGVGRRGGW